MLQKILSVILFEYDDYLLLYLVFGFWLYLMIDCVIFVVLFVMFVVFGYQYVGGQIVKELFDILGVVVEIVVLLLLSIMYGFVMFVVYKQ